VEWKAATEKLALAIALSGHRDTTDHLHIVFRKIKRKIFPLCKVCHTATWQIIQDGKILHEKRLKQCLRSGDLTSLALPRLP
jgi:hypothetical protein